MSLFVRYEYPCRTHASYRQTTFVHYAELPCLYQGRNLLRPGCSDYRKAQQRRDQRTTGPLQIPVIDRDAALSGAITPPDIRDYFPRIVEYCLATDWGKATAGV